MPESLLKKLPPAARSIWNKVYNKYKSKLGSERASKLAIAAIKNKYKKVGNIWKAKSAALKLTLIKSGLFFPDYKFRIEISNTDEDDEGERVDPQLLASLVRNNKVSRLGDVDHEKVAREEGQLEARSKLTSDIGTEGLYYLDKVAYEEGRVVALIGMNKRHKLYNKYLGLHKQGQYLYASAEFENYKTDGKGTITEADSLGWTITNHPLNKGARVLGLVA